jgi:transcriptional regulator with XRE-family HTH domain
MRKHRATRNEASATLVALRTAMKMSQAQFAVMVLETAVTTIARYETSHPPQGDLLLRLAAIAEKQGLNDLRDVFRKLYLEDVKEKIGFDLLTVAKTETEPRHGYLFIRLDGEDAHRLAQSVLLVNAHLHSDDPQMRENALFGVSSLEKTARKFENPAVGELQDAVRLAQTVRQHQPSARKTSKQKKQSN